MAQIAPFCGIRPDPSRFATGDLSDVIAPPYDVLSEADRDGLLVRHERNIVAVDLPHMPPGFAGPPEAYARAAETMQAWLADGTLIRDDSPVLYVYHQQFTHEGRPITRRMFFARLRLEPFGAGTVFPHERTFGGPKEDRLMLTRATRCNVSPIFGMYPDPDNEVSALLDVADREAICHGCIDDVENRMWVVDDAETIDHVVRAMADRAIFIADGHHRYGTALMYRDEVVGQAGSLSDVHPVNFVLVVLCAMEDDGLLILPTHRLLTGLDADRAIASLEAADDVQINPIGTDVVGSIEPGAFRIYDGAADRAWDLKTDGARVLAGLAPEQSEAWRRLDVAVVHRYLIDEVLRRAAAPGQEPEVRYVKDAAAGRRKAREKSGLLIEMAPTSLTDMKLVCQAGELMPQKSTYFYPKLATGLLINPLTD